MRPSSVFVAVLAAGIFSAAPALAYRPFDGTDADTAEVGHFELELGPVHFFRLGTQSFLVAPALVLNLGIFENTELVIDASDYVALGKLGPGLSRASLLDDDIFLKHTFREGTLQGKTGVSIAAEGGVLTPEINGLDGVGASLDVITSYRWSFGTVHWNEWVELTREHHADLFTGLILEGPHTLRVRPVVELFYDKDFGGVAGGSVFSSGQTASALVGAIWEVRESFAVDAAFRAARVDDQYASEVRLGLTWAIAFWGEREATAPPPP